MRDVPEKGSTEQGQQRLLTAVFAQFPAAILFGLGLLATTLVYLQLRVYERTLSEHHFLEHADEQLTNVESAFQRHEQLLASLASLFSASENLNAQTFSRLATPFLDDRPALQALQWAPQVQPPERSTFEQTMRVSQPNFRILGAERDVGPWYPVQFSIAKSALQHQHGLNLATDPQNRRALQQARDMGLPIASVPTTLDAALGTENIFLLFLPVFHHQSTLDSTELRRKHLRGFVVATISPDIIVGEAREGHSPGELRIELVDIGADTDTLTESLALQRVVSSRKGDSAHIRPVLLAEKRFAAMGREWQLRTSEGPQYAPYSGHLLSSGGLIAGLALTLLSAFYLSGVLNRKQIIEQLVTERTAQLQETNRSLRQKDAELLRFQSAMNSSLDIVLMFDAGNLRIIFANRGATRALGYSRADLLQRTPLDLVSAQHRVDLKMSLMQLHQDHTESGVFDADYLRNDGTSVTVEGQIQYVPTDPPRYILTARDIQDRKQAEHLDQMRSRILEQIAESAPLGQVLDRIGALVTETVPDHACIVFVTDVNSARLRCVGHSQLHLIEIDRVEDISLDGHMPPFATAACLGRVYHTADIQMDEEWSEHQFVGSSAHGCYAMPIQTADSRLLGVLLLLSPGSDCGSKPLQRKLRPAAQLSRIAIERKLHERELKNSEQQYRQLVETSQDLIWSVDKDGRWEFVNRNAALAIYGYEPEEMLGHVFTEFQTEEQARRDLETFTSILKGKDAFDYETVHLRKDGREVHINFNAVVRRDESGQIIGTMGTGRDITANREAEQRINLFASVVANTHEGVMLMDANHRIVAVNPAFSKVTGYSEQEVLGQRPDILASDRHDNRFYRQIWQQVSDEGSWTGEIWNRYRDGEICLEWADITAIKDNAGRISHYVCIYSDISSQEHVRKRLHNLAYYDPLTSLPNRELFQDRLDVALSKAQRDNKGVALMFLDLDRFKTLNDTLGHSVGDRLLQVVATQLQNCVRDSDTVARLGGDEFTIIVTGVEQAKDAALVADKILASFSSPIDLDTHEFYVTTSIGISLYPEDGADPETLIKNADTAMYRAKEMGRNNYQFYTHEMSERFSQRLQLENELRKAVDEDRLELHYQPQIDLRSGRIIGVEALARWHTDQGGQISPDIFIALAEETGLISIIGQRMLRKAATQAQQWFQAGHKDLRVAINLSGYQLQSGDLPSLVDDIMRQCDLCDGRLELELTESMLMRHTDSTIDTLRELNQLGIQIAIDDFGTGYSSLSYLKRFDIDKLKIDRSFIKDIGIDRNDDEIVAAIISLAHNLNLSVIAEGVETRDQLNFLRALGCDEMQGFLFSRAVSGDRITEMLNSSQRMSLAG